MASEKSTEEPSSSEEVPLRRKSRKSELSIEEQLASAKKQIATEKAGKRKLFHSIVKLAEELRRVRGAVGTGARGDDKAWYAGGLWRSPQVLPAVWTASAEDRLTYRPTSSENRTTGRPKTSFTDLFFNLVIVTGFTRVGVVMSEQGEISFSSFCYYAMFFTVWGKQASYSTRFDTTDLSAQISTLMICIATLLASLSVQAPVASNDASRIMLMAAFVAVLHCFLYLRVLVSAQSVEESILKRHLTNHALFNMILTFLESGVWIYGVFGQSAEWEYRWVIFVVALVLASVRIPRAFLSADFNAAAAKEGLLFILLLGFLLQSVMVVASQFFTYQTPTVEQYVFFGAICILFFCMKLLYVEDSENTLAQDHALLVNRWAAFFYHIGHFVLLLSTTVLGSGLNLLTHSYLAAPAALAGHEKSMVYGSFAAILISTYFIKSMNLKRIPTDPRNRCLFVGIYLLQAVVLLSVAGISIALSTGYDGNGSMEILLENDLDLVLAVAGSAIFVVLTGWLDEGLELLVYESLEDSRATRVVPFGIWFCCNPPSVVSEEMEATDEDRRNDSAVRLSTVLTPLLSPSDEMEAQGYDSVARDV